ncbi:hypothetical protein ACTHOQ_08095 [Solibacillus silvestris]|uniref:hypothetical protein n=1 Tax=Solibacillus silvestris TaxID=76853 RepID=UPI003F818DFC
MKTYSFKLFGGYKVTLDQTEITIDYAGEKFWFIKKAKPRMKKIPYKEVLRVEYKEAGMTFGYIRIITQENAPYPSSTYVAQHDENAFMVEKDEVGKLNEVLDLLKKLCKNIEFVQMKA